MNYQSNMQNNTFALDTNENIFCPQERGENKKTFSTGEGK